MQKFSNRSLSASPTLTMDMANLVPAGESIASVAVTAELYKDSEATDPDPSAILVGSPTLSGTKILQQVGGGVLRATYVLTFKATFTDATYDVEQAVQTVARYVP